MVTIRPEQVRALDRIPERAFVEKLVQFARDNLGVWVTSLDDRELRWRVRSGIARARSHGFEWQSSIAAFVTLMLRFAPNFDEYPPIRAILDAAGTDKEGRADRLLTDVSGEDWEAVVSRYDPEAWYEFGAAGTSAP